MAAKVSQEKVEKRVTALSVLEDVFFRYVREEKSDQRASRLVPSILSEAAFASGQRHYDRGSEYFRHLEARKALDLLRQMPEHGETKVTERAMPETLSALWEALCLGILYGEDRHTVVYVDGLFLPARRTTTEEGAFKDVLRKQFDRLGDDTADQFYAALCKRGNQGSTEVLRGLLRSLVNHVSGEHLSDMLKKPEPTASS